MAHPPPDTPDPDLRVELDDLIEDVVPESNAWRRTPNALLAGKSPDEVIRSGEGNVLRDLLRAAKLGMFS